MQFAPQRGPVRTIGGTPNDVVNHIAAGLSSIANACVRVRSVAADEPGLYPPTTGFEVAYDLKVESLDPAKVGRALWEGNLLVGAVADAFAARGFEKVIGASATLVTPSGMRRGIGGGLGNAVRDQVFDDVPTTLAETVATRARERGLRNVRVGTVRGLQDAVVIEARTDTPQATARQLFAGQTLDDLLDGSARRFEGVYFNVVDGNGDAVLDIAIAPRAAASSVWVRPGLGIQMRGAVTQSSARGS